MKSPFKFLDAYTKEDRDIFFGREKEIEELYHRVFDSRIMLVYGESGTGKSSLIQCGLANKFRDSDWLPLMIRRGDNLPDSIARAVKTTATTPIDYELLTTAMFKKAIRSLYIDYYKPIFFIFDQFEELFIFGSKEEKQSLVHLVHALVDSDIECRFIFAMREEYIANVTEFEKSFPGFLSNRIRIERMSLANAAKAINGPCEVYDIEVEEGFAEKLLKKMNPDTPGVELTYLQVYLDKIFNLADSEAEKEKAAITFANILLEKTGNVSDILGTFLDDQIALTSDKEAALVVLKSFVSVKGTKRQLTIDEARENVHTLGKHMNDPELMELIQRFVHLRILRDKDQYGKYELRHDALAKKIFEKFTSVEKELIEIRQFIDNSYDSWLKRKVLISAEDLDYISPYESKLQLPAELSELIGKSKKELIRRRQLRRNLMGISGIALIVVLSGFTIWALLERKKSDINYIKAKANNYGMMAREIALTDPTKALRLAEFAMSLDSSEDVRKIMYQIYRENSFYKIIAKLTGSVNAICLSPDGKYILTGCQDGTARLMDLQGNIIQEYKAHTNAVSAIAFSPTGDSVLTGSWDNNAILWKINGEVLHTYKGHSNIILSVTFSPNGNRILTGSNDNTAKLWNVDGTLLHEYKQDFYCRSVCFSADGKSYLTNADSLSPGLISIEGQRIMTFPGHSRAVQRAIFSPDFKSVLSTSTDGTAILFDLDSKIRSRFVGHTDRTLGIAFSPDGKKLLTTSEDNTVRVWNLNGELIQVLKGHEGNVLAAIFSKDGNSVYSVSADQTVRSWKLQNNIQQLFNIPKELGVRAVQFSPESKTLLILRNYNNATLYDLQGNIIHDYRDPDGTIGMIDLSPDGQTILTGAVDNTRRWVRLLNPLGKELAQFRNIIWGGFISDSIIYIYGNQNIRYYNLTGKLLNQFKCISQSIYPSPDRKTLLYSNGTSTWLTDIQNNRLKVFKGHEGPVISMAFSSDGKMILTGSNDNTAILWNPDGSPLHVYKEHTGEVRGVAFSPDGQKILTRDVDAVARLWDLKGNLLQSFREEGSPMINAFFTDGGDKILSVSRFGAVHLSDIKEPLTDFQKQDLYEKLIVLDKIEMGLISFNEILKINDPEQLFEAAEWYYSNSSIAKTDKKEVYLKNTFILFDKISEFSPEKLDFLLRMLRIYTELYLTNPTGEMKDKIADINIKVLNLKPSDESLNVLSLYLGYMTNSDSTLTKLKFDDCFIQLCDRIIDSRTILKASPVDLIKVRQTSWTMLLNKQYKPALKGLEVCLSADSTSEYHLCFVTMAYILNDQYDKAARIFVKWKDVPLKGYESMKVYSYGDGFLWWIKNLESRRFTHPDFERAKELLKK